MLPIPKWRNGNRLSTQAHQRLTMAQTKKSWNPLDWFASRPVKPSPRKANRLLALEALESREVPAVITVTNLYDSINEQTPEAGSLREAVNVKAQPGDTIVFDAKLFQDNTPQTLTLNGAVGYLNVIQNNISIVGPGVITSGQYSGQYNLKIQADTGITSVRVVPGSGGTGYQVGDILRQGVDNNQGGAEFIVQSVNPFTGEILQASVSEVGANQGLTVGTQLSYTGTKLNSLASYTGSGTRAVLEVTGKGYSSSIIWAQQISAPTQNLTLSGIQFGNAREVAIQQNLGNLSISDCLFKPISPTDFTPIYINGASGAGTLSIVSSAFDGGGTHVNFVGSGPITVQNSSFNNAGGNAVNANGASITINNSSFTNGSSGVYSFGATASVNNTYFTNIGGGALSLNTGKATVSNSFFENNTSGSGAAINHGGSNLTVTKSLFVNNRAMGLGSLASGGGAIYNYGGNLTLDQTGFENNYVQISSYPWPNDTWDPAADPQNMPTSGYSGGGAVYSAAPNTLITNSYFTGNQVESRVDFWVNDPDAPTPCEYGGGGALYVTGPSGVNATIQLQNLTVTNNKAWFNSDSPATNPLTRIKATGNGLNGGGIIISSAIDPGGSNIKNNRPFNGTTSASIINCTVANNSLQNLGYFSIDPVTGQLIGSFPNDSNRRSVSLDTDGNPLAWANYAASGGIFNDTAGGSSLTTLNAITMNNTGISYAGPSLDNFDGVARLQTVNISSRYTENGVGSFGSSGYSMYNNTQGYGTGARGDLMTLFSPSFDGGIRNNLGPAIGLLSPITTITDQGQGNILTIALDRFSPGRDAGNSSVYPTPLPTDARGVNRFINLAVDMGAFEVQTATATGVMSPALNEASPPVNPNRYLDATFGVPFSMTAQVLPNDNRTPTGNIGGTVYLVSANDNNLVYASGPVTPANPSNPLEGGKATLSLNSAQRSNTVQPQISTINATFSLGPVGQVQSLLFAKNLVINAGQQIRFDSVSPNSTGSQIGTVISYDATSGLLSFRKNTFIGNLGAIYTEWNATLLDANRFPLAGNGNTQTIWIATNTPNLVPGQVIRLYPLDSVGNPVLNSGYQLATITAYNSATGQLSFTQDSATSSGTYRNWQVALESLPSQSNNYILIYSGDPSYALSQSNIFTINVSAAQTTTTLSPGNPSTVLPGDPVTFTGSVSFSPSVPPPVGTVELQRMVNNIWQSLGTQAITATSGQNFSFTTSFPQALNYPVKAVFTSADATRYSGSPSNTVTELVGYLFNSFTAKVNPASSPKDKAVTFRATATYNISNGPENGFPTGVVQFYAVGSPDILIGQGFQAAAPVINGGIATIEYATTVTPYMLPFGSNTIVARYQRTPDEIGNLYQAQATTNTTFLNIEKVNPSLQLGVQPTSSASSPLVYGTPIVFTATIDGSTEIPFNPSAPGTVDFYRGATLLATQAVTLQNGQPLPVLYTSVLDAGTYDVYATYSGDGISYNPAGPSNTIQTVVDKAFSTLSLSAPDIILGQTIPLKATLTSNAQPDAIPPGGIITFFTDIDPNPSIENWVELGTSPLVDSDPQTPQVEATFNYQPTKGGYYNFMARYAGSANYTASEGTARSTVSNPNARQTTTTLTTSTDSAKYGTPVILTATVGPIGGLPFQAGTSFVNFYQKVNGAETLLNPTPIPVEMDKNSWPLPVSYTSTAFNVPGAEVRAAYSGDLNNYNPSTSAGKNIITTRASTAMTLVSSNLNPEVGTSFTLTATLSNDAQSPSAQPSGSIDFYEKVNGVEQLMQSVPMDGNFKASLQISTSLQGERAFVAKFSQATNYSGSQAGITVNVLNNTATQTSLTVSNLRPVYGTPVTLTATVTPGGPPAYLAGSVEFWSSGTRIGIVQLKLDGLGNPLPTSLTTSAIPGGLQTVTANYSGDGNRHQGSTSQGIPLTVAKATTTLTLSPSASRVEAGSPLTLVAALTSNALQPAALPGGTVEFFLGGISLGTHSVSAQGTTTMVVAAPSGVGQYTYNATYSGNTNYTPATGATQVTTFVAPAEPYYVVAPQQGSMIQFFNRLTNTQASIIQPLGAGYQSGFTVAKGDVNGDNVVDYLYAPRSGGVITVLDGTNLSPIGQVAPFGSGFGLPLSITVGDINGDGNGDIIAAPGGVGAPPHVVALSGKNLGTTLFSQYAYSAQFLGGVSVAAGEVNGDGKADIITAPLAGAPPHIVIFNGSTGAVLQSYYAYSPLYKGGTSIAAADLNGDGLTEIITAASASAPHVVVVEAKTQLVKASFYAYAPQFGGGVRVTTVRDVNGDGYDDIVTVPGSGAGPNVVRFDGKEAMANQPSVIDSFFAYGQDNPYANYYGGAFVG